MYTTYTRIVCRISRCFLCMCVFCARRNMLVVQPVVELYCNLLKANCGTQFNEIQPVLEICAVNHSV